MDTVTNCIEASLGRAKYSLWTNLGKRKSGILKVVLDGLEDQVFNTLIFG